MYWEDSPVGTMIETPGRTVGEADIAQFAGISGDFNPIHVDATFGARSAFAQRIAHGALGLSIATGLLSRTALLGPTAVAFAGINQWRFVAPIMIGDTIRVRAQVTQARPTRDVARGLLHQAIEVVNQHDAVVQQGEFVVLVERRPTSNLSAMEQQQ